MSSLAEQSHSRAHKSGGDETMATAIKAVGSYEFVLGYPSVDNENENDSAH